MADELASAFVQKVFGVSEPTRAPLSHEEQVLQFRRLNRTGWEKLITRYGAQEARRYHDDMTKAAKELGL